MPDPGVSLIPRGSKSTKKRRTSFRPASKKSNQNKSKAANASKAAKAAVSKNAEEASASTTDAAASTLSSLVDSALAAAATATAANTTKSNSSTDVGASQPLSPPTKQSAPQSPQKEKSSGDDTITQVEATPPRTTRSSSTNPSSPTRTNSARKRKAHSLNKKISIGSSLRRRTEASTEAAVSPGGKEAADTSGSVNAGQEKPKEVGEGKENLAALDQQQVKKHALTAASSHSLVPAFSAQDQAILNQLANEENEKEGKALNSFCTPFKGPKRRLQKDKEGTKQSSKKDNASAKDSASKSASRVSSNAAADNKGQKVDASTNGAPSVQIIDGQIVLQESSVVLPSRRTVQEVEEEFRDNVVEEDEQLNIVQASYTSFVTKGDHGKTRKKGSWTIEETEKFYFALRQLGTDFGSMEALFFEDQRTRKQLKNKYRKELAKNPDLVQELALNPKYQTQLDMDSLNLKVDPKRIEAHENEEPPAYEPTDVDQIEEPVPTKKSDSNESGADYNGVFEGEVVEEDAEEERLAEARAKQEQTTTASTPSAQQDGEEEENPFSSEFREGATANEEGPSMDDFFGDSYGDGNENADESASTKKEEASVASPPAKKAAATRKETSEMVSLVPKKANSKTRRPKIRPSRRRKS